MKLALFGGSGFIGRKVMHLLNEQHSDVIEISRNPISENSYHADICDMNSLLAIEESFDCVIICSSKLPQKEYSPKDLNSFTDVNIKGVNNILVWAHQRRVSKVIYCSTLSFLQFSGENDEAPLIDLSSHYIYKISKATAEHLVIGFCKQQHIDYCSLRIASVYGPGMKEDILSHFTKKIRNGEKIIIQNSNLSADFMHVDDVAASIIACTEKHIANQIINVASGNLILLRNLVQLICEILDLPLPVVEIKSEEPILLKKYSTEKINKILNQRIDLRSGIRQLISP